MPVSGTLSQRAGLQWFCGLSKQGLDEWGIPQAASLSHADSSWTNINLFPRGRGAVSISLTLILQCKKLLKEGTPTSNVVFHSLSFSRKKILFLDFFPVTIPVSLSML